MKNIKEYIQDLKLLMIETGAEHCICGVIDSDGVEELFYDSHDAIFYGDRDCLEYDVRKFLDSGAKAVITMSLHS